MLTSCNVPCSQEGVACYMTLKSQENVMCKHNINYNNSDIEQLIYLKNTEAM